MGHNGPSSPFLYLHECILRLDAMGAGKIKGNQPLLVRAMALLRKWDLSMSSHSIIAPLAYFAFRPYMEGPVAQRYYTACGDGSPDKLKWPSLLHLGLSEDHLLKDIENAGSLFFPLL